MDSLTQPEITNPARAVSVALTALLDAIDGDPDFALWRDEVFWSIRGASEGLSGRLYTAYTDYQDSALQKLELWQQKLGGEVQPTTENYNSRFVWYKLKTEFADVPIALLVPVEQPDVEKQLRSRIAELEAALQHGEGGEAR